MNEPDKLATNADVMIDRLASTTARTQELLLGIQSRLDKIYKVPDVLTKGPDREETIPVKEPETFFEKMYLCMESIQANNKLLEKAISHIEEIT